MTQWGHLTSRFLLPEKKEVMHAYFSHSLYSLYDSFYLEKVCEQFRLRGKKIQITYGGRYFLDQNAKNLAKNDCSKVVYFAQDTPFPKEGYALVLCGDYFIEVIEPELFKKAVGKLFGSIKNLDQLDAKALKHLFESKMPCEIKVTRNKTKAKALEKLFLSFYE